MAVPHASGDGEPMGLVLTKNAMLGCSDNVTTSSPPSPAPCITQPDISGLAAKLSVGGIPVLLDSAAGTTLPKVTPAKNPTGTWSVADSGQTKLTAAAV